jgi:hypothetical protein
MSLILSRFLAVGTIGVTSVTNALKGIVTSRCQRPVTRCHRLLA